MGDQARGGFEVCLHPLVVISISDHHTRVAVQREQAERVVGMLLGTQEGRKVQVQNSFEIPLPTVGDDGAPQLDEEFIAQRTEQYQKTFADMDVLGWYSTGADVRDGDVALHKAMSAYTESPLYLVMNTDPAPKARGLPMRVFEGEVHVVDGAVQTQLVETAFTMETVESERISVDHVTDNAASGSSNHATMAHLGTMHNSVKMLHDRVAVLLAFLAKTQAGELPANHSVLRQINSLCSQLPAMDSERLHAAAMGEYTDAQLVTLMASLTKNTNSMHELIGKYQVHRA